MRPNAYHTSSVLASQISDALGLSIMPLTS